MPLRVRSRQEESAPTRSPHILRIPLILERLLYTLGTPRFQHTSARLLSAMRRPKRSRRSTARMDCGTQDSSPAFPQGSPEPAYSPRRDQQNVSAVHTAAGKVIPELKFAFWEHMFTARHGFKIWKPQILSVFPNYEPGMAWYNLRSRVNANLQVIRKLRSRIAHHEPIFARNLTAEFEMIRSLVDLRSPTVSSWMMGSQIASELVAKPPFLFGGKDWASSSHQIAELASSIREQEGRQTGTDPAVDRRRVSSGSSQGFFSSLPSPFDILTVHGCHRFTVCSFPDCGSLF